MSVERKQAASAPDQSMAMNEYRRAGSVPNAPPVGSDVTFEQDQDQAGDDSRASEVQSVPAPSQ